MSTNPNSGSASRHPDSTEWQRLAGELPQPGDPAEQADVVWQALCAYFRWYDRIATSTRLSYQVLKVGVLILGAAVTVLAAIRAPSVLTAGLAAGVVVLEGIQQVFQLQSNWITYRSSAETLRQHAFLYVAKAYPYADAQTRRDRLAEVMRDITAKESTSWIGTMRQAAPTLKATNT
jgi:Protein of unknown function (DUF4231)